MRPANETGMGKDGHRFFGYFDSAIKYWLTGHKITLKKTKDKSEKPETTENGTQVKTAAINHAVTRRTLMSHLPKPNILLRLEPLAFVFSQ